MKIDKCELGYIAKKKKISFLWLMVSVLIGVAIFLIGYFWTHTRANIFTVVAVLMVLPAAKHIVSLIILFSKKGVSKERFDKIKEASGNAILLTEYVFTSTEKIMNLDFVLIKNGNVLAVKAPAKQDVEYMKKYLEDSVHKAAPSFHVKVFDTDEQLLKQLNKLAQAEAEPAKEEKVVECLRSLAV